MASEKLVDGDASVAPPLAPTKRKRVEQLIEHSRVNGAGQELPSVPHQERLDQTLKDLVLLLSKWAPLPRSRTTIDDPGTMSVWAC